ncbi:MAG: translation initiation factor IF-2 [Syntrophorhabdaceae bacterium]|nr:translation initiation factor IF-2 [Syntrophorhabdaceae bacterium]
MAKIKLTTLTEKMGDEEVLARLKSLGVKVKDRKKEVEAEPKKEEKPPAPENTVIEKRIGSGIIRRRVQQPVSQPQGKVLPEEKPKAPVGKKEEIRPDILHGEKEKTPTRSEKEEEVTSPVKVVLTPQKPTEKIDELVKMVVEPETTPHVPPEKPKVEIKPVVVEEIKKEPPPQEEPPSLIEPKEEDKLKGDLEPIAEEEKIEITKVLEEAYKHELEKDVTLGDEESFEDERKKKKVEKLLKRLEEQEAEEYKQKKKSPLKRKVVIKEEELYGGKRMKAKATPHKRDKKERQEVVKEEEKKAETKPQKKIKIGDTIQVDALAKRLGIKAQEIISRLFSLGIIATINQSIDYDAAFLVANELGFEVEKALSIEDEFLAMEEEKKEKPEDLKPRPPVVTIMGHVDHGKTLLLDTIRNTKVAEREAGGITQHIGAYVANVNGKEIIFVDTPGHEAFTAMRARGAKVTDIVVLVVAADDGVMPQTIEAINHAKAANVPIIVAINKIDKANANPDRVVKDLAELGLIPEEWGGTTLYAKISAKRKIGIEDLLELILLQAEMLELKANPDKSARGIIIESELDKGHGPVGTVIIQDGTLKIQDPFIAGTTFGRVRAMIDDKGKRVQKATPSMPILVVGFQDVPQAGDKFIVTTEESYAKELAKFRSERMKEQVAVKSARTTLEELYSKIGENEKTILNVIVKGDMRGTIDAINETLKKMSNDLVEIQIIHSGVGAITETDVNLATTTGAIIVGFNTKPIGKALSLAEQERVEIRTYSVIYDLIDDIKKAMEGMLAPKVVETTIGKAEVRKVFTISKTGTIAGSYMLEGKATRNAMVRVIRRDNLVHTGKIASLKRFKDDVREVLSGYEFGVSIEGLDDIKEGDILEFYIEEKEKQTLNG